MPYKDPAKNAACRKQWAKNNRDKLSRYQKAWRAAHPSSTKVYAAKWLKKNPGKRAALTRRWRQNNPKTVKAQKIRWAKQNPLLIKAQNLRRTMKIYGLTIEQYNSLAEKQNHQCAICGAISIAERHGRLLIDHNHATGKVRELLCQSCNITLGASKENCERLRLCADYLDKHA